MKRLLTITTAVAVGLLLMTSAWVPQAQAIDCSGAGTDCILNDANSSAAIDPNTISGMYDWTMDGQSQLFQQWFWFRVGNTAEASIDTLTLTNAATADVNNAPFNDGDEIANIAYSGTGFDISITYVLTGGLANSGTSDIAETIVINNTGGTTLDFHFYQYTDLDLGGTTNDTAQVTGVSGSQVNAIGQTDLGGTLIFNETVITPPASAWEIAFWPTTIGKLNDGVATNLSNATSPLGPGDVTYAFQWDASINPGGSLTISKDKNIRLVPEPATVMLLGSGLLGLLGAGEVRRRRFTK